MKYETKQSLFIYSVCTLMLVIAGAIIFSSVANPDQLPCISSDCNGDGQPDIDDIIRYYDYILGGGEPCVDCPCLEIGKAYVVVDTSQHEYRKKHRGDSCFAYAYFHVTIDSVKFLSKTQLRRWSIEVKNFTETTFVGITDFYHSSDSTVTDTMGIQ